MSLGTSSAPRARARGRLRRLGAHAPPARATPSRRRRRASSARRATGAEAARAAAGAPTPGRDDPRHADAGAQRASTCCGAAARRPAASIVVSALHQRGLRARPRGALDRARPRSSASRRSARRMADFRPSSAPPSGAAAARRGDAARSRAPGRRRRPARSAAAAPQRPRARAASGARLSQPLVVDRLVHRRPAGALARSCRACRRRCGCRRRDRAAHAARLHRLARARGSTPPRRSRARGAGRRPHRAAASRCSPPATATCALEASRVRLTQDAAVGGLRPRADLTIEDAARSLRRPRARAGRAHRHGQRRPEGRPRGQGRRRRRCWPRPRSTCVVYGMPRASRRPASSTPSSRSRPLPAPWQELMR